MQQKQRDGMEEGKECEWKDEVTSSQRRDSKVRGSAGPPPKIEITVTITMKINERPGLAAGLYEYQSQRGEDEMILGQDRGFTVDGDGDFYSGAASP